MSIAKRILSPRARNSQTHSTSKVWPSDHQEDDRSCAWPYYSLVQIFIKQCTLTNKAVCTIWRDMSKPPQRRQYLVPRPLWLLVGTPLVIGGRLASRRAEHIAYSGGCPYIFLLYCFYHLTCLCHNFYCIPALVGCWSSLYWWLFTNFFNVCPFSLHSFCS